MTMSAPNFFYNFVEMEISINGSININYWDNADFVQV